ncbi:Uncharacterized protein DAT39_001635 [Clarias magur]|uniref:Uncharacterized protein n=1 Tax=Clarias magur TaxID=1594786 RepID=A0A8J4X8M7_CLAMG|nr:Uncharacterized protein DAT39_001635 [Clarias magur]
MMGLKNPKKLYSGMESLVKRKEDLGVETCTSQMSMGGLVCIKGEIKGEMSASRHAWLLGSADVCCLVDDTEAGDEFQLSHLAT